MKTRRLHWANIGKGNLIVVNPDYPLQKEPAPDKLAPVGYADCSSASGAAPQGGQRAVGASLGVMLQGGQRAVGSTAGSMSIERSTSVERSTSEPGAQLILLDRQAANMLAKVMALLGCGRDIVPVSGYRTMREQQELYAQSVRDNGPEFTRQYVAIPGCSEHQSGLAIDLAENGDEIDFIRPSFPYTGVCQRFREKSALYGFIERYPAGRERITRISHEPWHFRYVGYPHSALMREMDVTLEEYMDYLKRYPFDGEHLRVKRDGRDFDISYVAVPENKWADVALPEYDPVQVSGNNMDGFIVTLWGRSTV